MARRKPYGRPVSFRRGRALYKRTSTGQYDVTFPALLTGAMKEGNGNAQVTPLDTARICIAGQVYGDVQTSLDARVGVGCSDAHTRITPSLRVDYRLRLVSSLIGGSARQARGGLNPVRAERPPGNPK